MFFLPPRKTQSEYNFALVSGGKLQVINPELLRVTLGQEVTRGSVLSPGGSGADHLM